MGDDNTAPSREELRARLRNKLGAKRNARVGGGDAHSSSSSNATSKAEQAALSLAGDDPQLLQMAQHALRDPQGAKRMLQTLTRAPPTLEDDDDDEAPPPS